MSGETGADRLYTASAVQRGAQGGRRRVREAEEAERRCRREQLERDGSLLRAQLLDNPCYGRARNVAGTGAGSKARWWYRVIARMLQAVGHTATRLAPQREVKASRQSGNATRISLA